MKVHGRKVEIYWQSAVDDMYEKNGRRFYVHVVNAKEEYGLTPLRLANSRRTCSCMVSWMAILDG